MSPIGLPAEGITLEYIAKPFRGIALQPIITGAALAASVRYPQHVASILSSISNERVGVSAFTRAMKVLLAVGALYRLNKLLSRLVLNNWTSDRTWDWRKEIVIVTGGCSGIGELISSKLAKQNVKVVILDVFPPGLDLPANTHFYQTDVTSSEAIAKTANQIRKEVGNPTVLINNAGIGSCKPFLEETEAQIRATFNVNIVAHFLLTREFLPYMIEKNHGHVVTMASLASFMVHASNVDYCCTKAGVLAFHEGLAQELKHRYGANKVRTT
jgi:all-trans-retinol dehydrogenase (NAD+)